MSVGVALVAFQLGEIVTLYLVGTICMVVIIRRARALLAEDGTIAAEPALPSFGLGWRVAVLEVGTTVPSKTISQEHNVAPTCR